MFKINDIQKKFGSKSVLQGISTEFPEHQTTVIVGPSGSGKTTLLRSLDLLVQPDAGTLALDDLQVDFSRPVDKKTKNEFRDQTSMVFQNWNLFPNLTILQNITVAPIYVQKVPKEQAETQARALLKEVGLSDYADVYPQELSGGQQQRISICRALAVHPKYILLDEPTSALDPEMETQVLKMLEQLAGEGQSMIVVTHNMQFAKNAADKILFLEDGQLQFDGSCADFFAHPTPRVTNFLQGISLN
ncbi:amino acid ABC transporter ATP-binding protein [Fructilactobacillus myrtifloralis]|uniref:Amino acid ABC transporter ATP-binding protein n=1 Tax=Fructilactobacillus myrtifloralis TaxID=2940301 RepID=A0ABY5BRC6_9LACO|nr:amino acid ABC transporter ATP-binding protein [Fructilactobacillus myrtifloralis]USS85461.1 amino acid ABC transporter ATP-binding protein [Fructilactobacillus myrtifloralis]